MIRRLCGVLCLTFLLCPGLAGCAPRAAPVPRSTATLEVIPTPAKPERPANTPQAMPTDAPVTINYLEQEPDDGDVLLDQLTASFMKENPRIRVERSHWSSEELGDQFQIASAAGHAPVLVRAPNESSGRFSTLHIIRPIRELYNEGFLERFYPGSLDAVTIKGKLWGVPDNYGYYLMLLYNKKLVSGPVPANTDAWIEQLKTLTDAGKGTYGLVYDLNEPFWLVPWLGGFGGWPLDDSDAPSLGTGEMVDALRFVHDLKFVHKVVPSEADYNAADTLFKEGKAAYLINGDWSLSGYREAKIDFGTAALPTVSITGRSPSPMTSGKYWMFSSRVEDQAQIEAAKKFVEYMTSAGAQQKWLEMGRLPSSQDAAKSDTIKSDPILQGSMAQLANGRGLPAAAEMRCAWDAMRPTLESVMAGTLEPAGAAEEMQAAAEKCVAEMGIK
jgi:arabinogalactan oligomer / maltooligosaccharide transport system substrate-binding protein